MTDSDPAAEILLLRHGEVEGGPRYRGSTDDRLTTHGIEQMWAALADVPLPQRVVTSPLARCAQFAHALARRHALPVRVDERWREIDFGAWEGQRAADVEKTSPAQLARFYLDPWNHGPPDGEPLRLMRARVLAAWREVTALGQRVLVVSHGGPIRVVLCEAHGTALQQLLQIDVPNGALFRIPTYRVDAADAQTLVP